MVNGAVNDPRSGRYFVHQFQVSSSFRVDHGYEKVFFNECSIDKYGCPTSASGDYYVRVKYAQGVLRYVFHDVEGENERVDQDVGISNVYSPHGVFYNVVDPVVIFSRDISIVLGGMRFFVRISPTRLRVYRHSTSICRGTL